MKLIDLCGRRYGKLVVMNRDGVDPTGKAAWFCKCDCGSTSVVTGMNLKSGNTNSCGCAKSAQKVGKELSGQRFGDLTVVGRVGSRGGRSLWECVCSCGVFAAVVYSNLVRGVTRSCGCKKLKNGEKRWVGVPTSTRAKWAKRTTEHSSCARCGAQAGLHAHHIYPASIAPSLKLDGTNGIALCGDCHRSYHAQTPLDAASPAQLCEWLGIEGLLAEFFTLFVGYREKGGIQDLEKAKHCIDMLIQFEREKAPADPFDATGVVS